MLKKRGAGVLFHISSMPSPYGVGVFNSSTIDFIDKLHDMGFTYWQVLPFNPIDNSNSPYCSPSAFAGNYLFINPEGLLDMGLIEEADVKENIYDGSPYTANYEFAAEKRLAALKKAYSNINESISDKIKCFEFENPGLSDYAVFMAVKELENGRPWWQWSKNHSH
ncbi:MAG: 4-alpha-glucanotransferase, partial [Eubacterium sp.]|nr:4-alpha-glucanotransferase [Eubacterium sp.]